MTTNSVTPAVSISASSTSICAGSSVTFTATPTNGGTTPVYQWQVNGVNAGTNSATLTTSSLANGDKITAKITSNDPCASPSTATSNAVTIIVSAAIQGIRYPSVTAGPNNPLQLQARDLGTNYSYQWSPFAGLSSSNIQNPVFNYDKKTEYTIRLTSNTGCVTVDTLLVILSNTAAVVVPNAWSPNGDGHNDYLYPLTISITQLRYFRIFNRWGQKVFETNIIGRGWDGIFQGKPQPMDVYTWTLEAVSSEGHSFKLAGKAVLMR
jgi:gliding motility-associated-like protein